MWSLSHLHLQGCVSPNRSTAVPLGIRRPLLDLQMPDQSVQYHHPLPHVALSRNCMLAFGHRWATSRLRAVGSPDVPILLCNLYSGMVAETCFVLWLTCRPRSHTTAGVCRPFSALHWAATVQYTWLSRRRLILCIALGARAQVGFATLRGRGHVLPCRSLWE